MRTLHAQTAVRKSVSARRLQKLERTGRYEEALALFGEGWQSEGYLPQTAHLPAQEAAEVNLRFGSLIGFNGGRFQVFGSQDRSKDILTCAREAFITLGNTEKVAECENHIALAYWRKGEHADGSIWVSEALSHSLPSSSDARLYGLLTKSLLLLSEKRDHENIELCLAVEDQFHEFADNFLRGSLMANLGVSYRNLGDNSLAMRYFSRARTLHENSRHKTYLAIVENNLALLHNAEARFEAAHEAADRAIKLYRSVKDKAREASSLDSKAQIFLAGRRYDEGLKAANRSIAILKKGEESAYLAESLFTKARLLLAGGDVAGSLICLAEAINITRLQNSEAAARMLADEYSTELKHYTEPLKQAAASVHAHDIELVLPPSLAEYSEYKGLWIHTDHFQCVGITRGDLAILTPGEVRRGDLVAVLEVAAGSVCCGFYDSDYGIVCLDRRDGEPLLFDATGVEILGKVIGTSSGKPDGDGKTHVDPLKVF